jgi:hypothetical protein
MQFSSAMPDVPTMAQQLKDHRDLVRLVRDRLLGEGEAQAMGTRGEQMGSRSPLLLAPAERFAVNGYGVLCSLRRRLPRQQPLGPRPQLGLQHLSADAPEDRTQGRGTRRSAGKAQRPPQRFLIMPAPRCNSGIAPVATGHRATSQGDNCCQWVPLATRAPEVWYLRRRRSTDGTVVSSLQLRKSVLADVREYRARESSRES